MTPEPKTIFQNRIFWISMQYCRVCKEQVSGSMKEHMETKHAGFLEESKKWYRAGSQVLIIPVILLLFLILLRIHYAIEQVKLWSYYLIPVFVVSFIVEIYIFYRVQLIITKYRKKIMQNAR